ncbi:hypothetical protein LZ30DRAFT_254976 [Colletotrichum cereale]|nr:hypothetical protein LZ30DRAFT_254976 [Colletotrichum cereale]
MGKTGGRPPTRLFVPAQLLSPHFTHFLSLTAWVWGATSSSTTRSCFHVAGDWSIWCAVERSMDYSLVNCSSFVRRLSCPNLCHPVADCLTTLPAATGINKVCLGWIDGIHPGTRACEPALRLRLLACCHQFRLPCSCEPDLLSVGMYTWPFCHCSIGLSVRQLASLVGVHVVVLLQGAVSRKPTQGTFGQDAASRRRWVSSQASHALSVFVWASLLLGRGRPLDSPAMLSCMTNRGQKAVPIIHRNHAAC